MTLPQLPTVAVIIPKIGLETVAKRTAMPVDFHYRDAATYQRIKLQSRSRKVLRQPCRIRPNKSVLPCWPADAAQELTASRHH